MPPPLYPRLLRPRLDEALADTRVVLLNGPRQAGKTTLVQQFADARRRYLSLDDVILHVPERRFNHGPQRLRKQLLQAVGQSTRPSGRRRQGSRRALARVTMTR